MRSLGSLSQLPLLFASCIPHQFSLCHLWFITFRAGSSSPGLSSSELAKRDLWCHWDRPTRAVLEFLEVLGPSRHSSILYPAFFSLELATNLSSRCFGSFRKVVCCGSHLFLLPSIHLGTTGCSSSHHFTPCLCGAATAWHSQGQGKSQAGIWESSTARVQRGLDLFIYIYLLFLYILLILLYIINRVYNILLIFLYIINRVYNILLIFYISLIECTIIYNI